MVWATILYHCDYCGKALPKKEWREHKYLGGYYCSQKCIDEAIKESEDNDN